MMGGDGGGSGTKRRRGAESEGGGGGGSGVKRKRGARNGGGGGSGSSGRAVASGK